MAKDGTAVLDEDYFSTIAPQTLFIVATQHDKVQTGKHDNGKFLDTRSIDIKLFQILSSSTV